MADRAYLYIEQLAELTPWSSDAIRTKMTRGEFLEGKHYFKPNGPKSRPIFCWNAIVEYIECGGDDHRGENAIPLANGTIVEL